METIANVRTGIIFGEKKAVIEKRRIKAIGINDVLIRVKACNLCTSEYGIWSGARKNRSFPFTFGHEWAGEIIKKGSNVNFFETGDFVAGSYGYDVYSEEAKEGRTSESPGVKDYEERSEDGFYGRYEGCAEYLVMPQESLFKMKKDISPSEAGFLEPVSTVVAGIRRLNLSGNETIAIVGAGTMGLLNAMTASQYGYRVILTEFLPKKIEIARTMGFEVVDGNQQDPVKAVRELTNNKGVDVVIVAVGTTKANEQAIQMLKKFNGSLLLFAAGYPSPEIGLNSNDVHYRKMKIQGAFSADFTDFKESARLLNWKKISVKPLIDEKYSFNQLQEAFEAAIKPGMYRISVIME